MRVLLLAAGLAAAAVFYGGDFLNHDTSMLLTATDRWLNGAALYSDIMEINPPLIFYMTAPAVILSKALGVNATTAFVVLLCAAGFVSLVWVWSLLRRVPEISTAARYLIVFGCYAALMFVPGGQWGQREHLFIVLALPYFFTRILRPMGLRVSNIEAGLTGLFGFPGFALKPYFLVPAAVVTAVNCRQERSLKPLFSPDNLVLCLLSLAYVAFVATIHPDYFKTVMPLGMQVYGAIGSDAFSILFRSVLPFLLIIAVATLNDAPKMRRTMFVISAVLAGMLGAYITQRKGWGYQLLPCEMMDSRCAG